MKIDLTQPILELNGQPKNLPDGTPVLLRNVVQTVLLNSLVGDEREGFASKDRMFQLALQAETSDEVDWLPTDVELVKGRIGRACDPLVVGRVAQLLSAD